jgi:hypothetical protein
MSNITYAFMLCCYLICTVAVGADISTGTLCYLTQVETQDKKQTEKCLLIENVNLQTGEKISLPERVEKCDPRFSLGGRTCFLGTTLPTGSKEITEVSQKNNMRFLASPTTIQLSVFPTPVRVSMTSLSHNGKWLALTVASLTSDTTALAIYHLETRETHLIVPFGNQVCGSAFSPADEFLAYYQAPIAVLKEEGLWRSDENGHRLWIYSMKKDSTSCVSPACNTLCSYPNFCPEWSPDGKKILFLMRNNPPGTPELQQKPGGISLYDLQLNNIRSIMPTEVSSGSPSWAPDSERFCCLFGNEIAVVNAKTSECTKLTIKLNPDKVAWAPVGEIIAVASGNGGTPKELHLINSSGKQIRQVSNQYIRTDYGTGIYWSK